MTIEQAVFVVDPAGQTRRCTLAARTAGLTDADASAIAGRLPPCGRPGDPWTTGDAATVCNLPDGRGIFTKMFQDRAPGHFDRILIHALLVSAQTLDRLGGDPAAVWIAAQEAGLITVAEVGEGAAHSSSGRPARRADARHGNSTPEAATTTELAGPSHLMPGVTDEIREMLEHLDETVFAAIGGDVDSLARVEVLWPLVASELEPEVAEQCREQYLRYAISIWNEFLADDSRDTSQAIAALDVLCLLFEA